MTRTRKNKTQREIKQYMYDDKKRLNNPPVGLVNSDNDNNDYIKTYSYDPHIDPELQFDSQRAAVEKLLMEAMQLLEKEEEAREKAKSEAAENKETKNLTEEQQKQQEASDTRLNALKDVLLKLEKKQTAYLNWAGKTEHTSFEVSSVSLHIHERIEAMKIIEAVRRTVETADKKTQGQFSFFEQERKPLRHAVDFYKQPNRWANRLIAGDSLLVMNSLLEKENMGGKVQMIYFDPPYGIKYKSNFQPFVNKRDATDRKDEDLTTEPEMIKAFRDTWQLGIHSYLTYMRDRLLLAKDMLHESGSIFVQISDENVHHVREIMDEVFGKENFMNQIAFIKTAAFSGNFLSNNYDYLIWYSKNKSNVKYHQLFLPKKERTELGTFSWIEFNDGSCRRLTKTEMQGKVSLPKDAKRFRASDLSGQGKTISGSYEIEFNNKKYIPPKGRHWTTNLNGINNLIKKNRIIAQGKGLAYKRFEDDYPIMPIVDVWNDTITGTFSQKLYVVQTGTLAIQKCLIMTTDPSDIVLDITCGSGTTAYVAEKFGRRWITCDTSRIALTLAKQRLMTATFPYYKLAEPKAGISKGFQYKTVPHITLKQLANDLPLGEEILYDKPLEDTQKVRVCSPFTVEAAPSPIVVSPDEVRAEMQAESVATYLDNSSSDDTLRFADLCEALLQTGIRGKSGQYISFSSIEIQPSADYIHAIGETKYDDRGAANISEPPASFKSQRVFFHFGNAFSPLEAREVDITLDEATKIRPKPDMLLFIAHEFDAEAAKNIDETKWSGIMLGRAKINDDIFTEDLRKSKRGDDSFWLIGSPAVELRQLESGEYEVEILGFDYYDTKKQELRYGNQKDIAMWLLDTDYDGRSLLPSQIFFPLAGATDGWHRLANSLRAEIDMDKIASFKGTKSLPFEAGRQVAVKIIDNRGIESLKVLRV